MVSAQELDTLAQWIDAGALFRVADDNRPSTLNQLDRTEFDTTIWPFLEAQCLSCHSYTDDNNMGAGGWAMDLDGDPEDAEKASDIDDDRFAEVATRVNYMIPEGSLILRKPLGALAGGIDHHAALAIDGLAERAKEARGSARRSSLRERLGGQ